MPHSSVGAQFGGLRRGIDLHPPAHLPGRVLREHPSRLAFLCLRRCHPLAAPQPPSPFHFLSPLRRLFQLSLPRTLPIFSAVAPRPFGPSCITLLVFSRPQSSLTVNAKARIFCSNSRMLNTVTGFKDVACPCNVPTLFSRPCSRMCVIECRRRRSVVSERKLSSNSRIVGYRERKGALSLCSPRRV